MTTQWDAVYGQGDYVAKVLGQGQDAQGVLTGSNGLTVKMEVHASGSANPAHGTDVRGVAEDNKGNIYKVTF